VDRLRQFHPISPRSHWQLLMSKPMYLFLDRLVKPKRVHCEYVRTSAKRAIMLARELQKMLTV
jgi:hypothetical protein